MKHGKGGRGSIGIVVLVCGLLALAQHGMLYVLVYRDVAGSLLAGGGELHTVVIAAFALVLRLLAFVVAGGLPAALVLAVVDANAGRR